ncbi:uncharacterized protein LOC122535723 isoform X2 [Frieseomelitta varia]|uniref:uncharacterized protein LOC122535723 isoform X2 n=1 Tax=Frieseomelitta varia TaxID=561572 RepID=UPI001CB6A2BA|nr:uncharacterized protein LOC122535723 isoform X2 [Frieseomelitta varia]
MRRTANLGVVRGKVSESTNVGCFSERKSANYTRTQSTGELSTRLQTNCQTRWETILQTGQWLRQESKKHSVVNGILRRNGANDKSS